ncbi:Calmodulin-binding protein 60 D [Hirschfeldia incana]|nr:Calmodulin-binding protein 60 D [Hirschfeldia incana]
MKRNLDNSNNDKQPERKRPALASVIVEAMKVDSLQKLCSSLEPILRRVVSEEVERAFAKFIPTRLAESSVSFSKRIGGGPDGRNLQLRFRTRLSLPLFTGGRVEGEQGGSIHVVLIDANTGRLVTFGTEASLKLEVVVLEGDFEKEDGGDWSQEEFESHVVKERDGKRPLLTGDLCVVLKDGVGTLGELVFTDNSSWIRSKKFRLALRVASGWCDGVRVREAKTEPFAVKDHRGELYKKHYPPGLNDEVWRLEKIGKDGAFHKKLTAEGIVNVEGFLRKLVKDSAKLRAILGSMSNKMWDVLVEHAKTCVLSGQLYIYYAEDSRTVGVVFNNIYELSGLISGDQYFSADSLDDSQKVYVDGLVKKAYDNWNQVVEYEGKQPERVDIPQTEPANYSELPPSTILPSQFPGFSFEGYNQPLPTAQLHNSQAPYDIVLQQDQFMGIPQAQTTTGMALVPPLQSTGGYQGIGSCSSVHQANLDPFEDWSRQHANEIQLRSDEMLESEDMQQLFQLCTSMGGGGGDGYGFPSFMQSTPMVKGYEEEERVRSGKAVVGWLKIKAAMKWGIFIRKKAAERRAQIVELD